MNNEAIINSARPLTSRRKEVFGEGRALLERGAGGTPALRGGNGFKGLNWLPAVLLLAVLAAGCKPASPPGTSGYFKTPFQDESQYIVETIVSDVAEQMYYAKFHQLPDANYFLVTADETAGSPQDQPVYAVEVRLSRKLAPVKSSVSVDGPIWSPEVYAGVAGDLAEAVGLKGGSETSPEDTALIGALTDGTAETIEEENGKLSTALEDDFGNPTLHEKAAVLLGAFGLREHSGYFYDIRPPLSRMTAHLVMAHFLSGGGTYGVNGQLGEAMMRTLIGDEAPALEQLDAIPTNDTAVASFVSALRMLNTGDFRAASAAEHLTRIESIASYWAMSGFVSGPSAWAQLSDEQKQDIDFVRLAYQQDHSVEMGHQLVDEALPLELQEIASVYELSQHQKLAGDGLVKALNAMPEGCFSRTGGGAHVRVIGWGQWAGFLQRQLCHAIVEDFDMLQYRWGVPDDASNFAAQADAAYGGLRLYPFVRRFDCTDVKGYHESVDEGTPVTIATPQLVPAEAWDALFSAPRFSERYSPVPNPHVNDWFRHNPPPGTVYDLSARLFQPSLTDRSASYFEALRALAPYDCRVADELAQKEYRGQPTYEQAMGLYSNVLPYSVTAHVMVGNTLTNQPKEYELLMLDGAKLSPIFYYYLGSYLYNSDPDKAAEYYDRACDQDPDTVRASNYATWRVRYCLYKGQTDKARQIAEAAGEVYSSGGLQSEGVYFEMTSNYDEAFDWYSKVKERYDDGMPLFNFCMRYRVLTGDNRFDQDAAGAANKLFPKGIEEVSMGSFRGPPADGVVVKQDNDQTRAAGLNAGDVIVAVHGIRMHNFNQYTYAREWGQGPELDLIVWDGNGYHEITASPPNRRFGVPFGDYAAK